MDTRVSELHIAGYRSLKDIVWRPGALNVVIGPNGSGKSNLLKALALIGASANGRLEDFIDEDGGMGAILWNGSASSVRFEVVPDLDNGNGGPHLAGYVVDLVRQGQSASYRISLEEFLYRGSESIKDGYFEPARPETWLSMSVFDEAPHHSAGAVAAWSEPSGVSPIPYDDPAVRSLKAALSSWQILDELKFERSSKARQGVTARYSDRLEPDGANLSSVLHTLYSAGDDFQAQIDDAMNAAFGDEYRGIVFPPTGGVSNIQLAIKWKSIKRPVATYDLSDGTLRFLAIVAALANPRPPALIAIDEPETGLHPRMMRIIAEYTRDAALRCQVVFTTHSAAFLDAFDRRDPPATAVAELVDGATTVRMLDPEELGRWLADYSLGSLYRSRELEHMGASE